MGSSVMVSSVMVGEVLRAWLDTRGEFNQGALVWLGGWSWWSALLALALGLSALVLAWRSGARLALKRRVSLLTLRLMSLVALFVMFLQPAARLEEVERVKNHIAVLIDASRSMALPVDEQVKGTGEGERRWDAALGELEAHRAELDELSREHILSFYRFDEHLSRVESLEALRLTPPNGEATRLAPPLDELLTRTPASELASVFVLSDGIETSQADYASLARASQRVSAPIHTLAVGPQEALRDVSIVEVRADDFAFARNLVSVDVALSARGYTEPLTRHVTLWRGRERLAQRLFTYDPQRGDHHEQVRFEFVPEETGEEVYKIEVEVGAEEQVTLNNSALFSMRVIRDKIRTLQVVGRPSWDVRSLRHHLQSNPNVELISFFILRTNASIETASPDELSLIPFPTQELFEERLGSFDLMFFQDFTYRGYRMDRYLPFIRDYVRQGGAFVMIGGEQSMSAGGYTGTPIADLLPFELPPNNPKAFTLGDFQPTLSKLGERHPVSALSLVPEENRALWASLPPLGGHNHAGRLKPKAQVLAWRELEGGERAPLLMVMPYGEGRVLTLNTDSLWRWSLEPKSEGATHYHRLWANAIRWLIRDPSLNPIKISAGKERIALGQRVTLKVQVSDASYQPLKGAEVSVLIEEVQAGERAGEPVRVTALRGVTEEGGEVSLTWVPERAGAYRAKATAAALGAELSAQDLFVVAQDPLELREISPRRDLLGALSSAGEGRALKRGQAWRDLPRVQPNVSRVNRRVEVPLWSGMWLLVTLTLLLSVEWLLRRRWGLA